MRSRFDQQLSELHRGMIRMGALCESAIQTSAKALLNGDTALAGQLGELHEEIDRREREIESLCLQLLLQQQPVAKDLRAVSSALKMITDMSRIGVQAGDIAEIVIMGNIRAAGEAPHICEMAREAQGMVSDSIDAFVKQDLALSDGVIRRDDVVDALFDTVKDALVARLRQGGDAEQALDLLMIAKYFERIADHAVNIAAWVEFSITGSHRREA